jgi:hypothetical protein
LTSSRAVFNASCDCPASRAACSFRRSAWVRRATPHRQLVQQLESARRIAVIERPLGGEQAGALLRRARRGAALRDLEGTPQGLVARAAVLQPMGAARGEQVRQDGELVVLLQLRRVCLDRERARCAASARGCSAAEVL